MQWFYNMKTAVKLISAFVLMAIIVAFVGFYGLANMSTTNDDLSKMYDNNLMPISELSNAMLLFQQIKVDVRDMNTMATTKAENDKYKDTISGYTKEIETRIDTYSKTRLTTEEQDMLRNFTLKWQANNKLLDQAMQMNAENISPEQFTEFLLIGGFKQSNDEIAVILNNLIALNIKLANQLDKDTDVAYESSRNITLVIILVSLIISVGLGYLISQMIARPLIRVVALVSNVAAGDLRETMEINTKDEVGQLASSINDMILSLRTTVSGILASSQSVAAAAQQISASAEEVASGSMSQANDAQMMNELFKELSTAINSVARNAEQTSELSDKTMGIAQEGSAVVRISIEGMSRVNQQVSRLEEDSNKIGEIIDVIDDIADQTNLLALNAAIEAARAGDQGRGFAVVADEVRKLAERSSEATKKITAIIKGMQTNTQQSVKAVGEGVIASQKTGESFENIVKMVNESAQKVTEIAAASEEQAAQSTEMLTSIESISAASEEAAASTEETATTAQSLANLAEELNNAVSIFKVN
ncbi:methyl-accepting chemotaxis protein [Paenibacillus agricola]|uniref:Methyl-accepting chemotaxis protein n=1 Tax=Paenibacillus agricola TaxID=2716264 RepID=A0ABX0JDC9_9BACL|nr:methyl-accepting chemotaxis protein [Paenibacillus agricola]NHN34490.1 methyl-accepting chemotaxis protein [Paenibacillus agricola]